MADELPNKPSTAPDPEEPSDAYVMQVDVPVAVPVVAPQDEIRTGAWDADICGCCTHVVPNCCMVTFCPCVSMAQIAKRLGIASYIEGLLGSFLLIYFGLGCFCVWHLRATARDKFQLPGSCCEDCFVSVCCSCCATAQLATHVKSYKPGDCSFGEPSTLPGFRR